MSGIYHVIKTKHRECYREFVGAAEKVLFCVTGKVNTSYFIDIALGNLHNSHSSAAPSQGKQAPHNLSSTRHHHLLFS